MSVRDTRSYIDDTHDGDAIEFGPLDDSCDPFDRFLDIIVANEGGRQIPGISHDTMFIPRIDLRRQ